MNVLWAFVLAVAAIMAVAALVDGRLAEGAVALLVAAGAGGLLWRHLSNPEARRAGGHHGMVTFLPDAGDRFGGKGTLAGVRTHVHATGWTVALDRTPERGDMALLGTQQRAWVWLSAAGLPEKVRIDYGSTWKTWPVLDAEPETTKGQA